MQDKKFDLGMIGLGTMGRNLLLNMADSGYSVTGYDPDEKTVELLNKEGQGIDVTGFNNLKTFVSHLNTPRALMLLVPAGKIVDDVIRDLEPLLNPGDLIIDGGNSYFTDTDRRFQELKKKDIHFFGMGISGGEEGARHGPSMMPGGDEKAYGVVKDILESVSAKVNGDPCVTYLGPGACGHFVKMVHNGIEYGMMQLLSEIYGIMRGPLNLSPKQMNQTFEAWDKDILQSFLVEITADIFKQVDEEKDGMLIDVIRDQAKSKGTGKWTSQIAMDLQVPVPTIDTAVAMRDLSKYKALRTRAEKSMDWPNQANMTISQDDLKSALYFSFVISYAQGIHMLSVASEEYGYHLSMADISRIWRGGCIIRAAILEDIYQAFDGKDLPHLLLDPAIIGKLKKHEQGFRKTVAAAATAGIGIPALSASLSYFDMFRIEYMPSNLIQAQRDYFGAHTYERNDREGVFHTKWN